MRRRKGPGIDVRLAIVLAVIGLLAACGSEETTPVVTPTRAAPRATWTPLPTSTIEVAPTETATAVPAAAQLVVTTNANLRAGPGTDFARVGSAKAGDRLEVTGRSADGTWFALASGAWIFGELAAERIGEGAGESDPLFVVGARHKARPMDRSVLHHLLQRIGERAGVRNTYPHRFRHTFAINYLRNGGDLFTLQAMLGHSDLEMVRRYARIAQVDVAQAQQRASPVDKWRL